MGKSTEASTQALAKKVVLRRLERVLISGKVISKSDFSQVDLQKAISLRCSDPHLFELTVSHFERIYYGGILTPPVIKEPPTAEEFRSKWQDFVDSPEQQEEEKQIRKAKRRQSIASKGFHAMWVKSLKRKEKQNKESAADSSDLPDIPSASYK